MNHFRSRVCYRVWDIKGGRRFSAMATALMWIRWKGTWRDCNLMPISIYTNKHQLIMINDFLPHTRNSLSVIIYVKWFPKTFFSIYNKTKISSINKAMGLTTVQQQTSSEVVTHHSCHAIQPCEPNTQMTAKECAGCGKRIVERYLLKALDIFWHEDCLKCGCCDCRLGEVGSTLYIKANLILCKRDYLRLFGNTGSCSACNKMIPAYEMVMRAKYNVYHLECFACFACQHRFDF